MSALSIRSMYRAMDLNEQLQEEAWKRSEHKRMVHDETMELVKKIMDFYPKTDEGHFAYTEWVSAGPDDNDAFLIYCRNKWVELQAEIVKAYHFAGFDVVVGVPSVS